MVDDSIEAVVVARWPGKLWLARIVDVVPDDDQPVTGAGYTRAFAVEVLREVPASRLFGEHGEAVCAVIAQASRLDMTQVRALACLRHAEAAGAYSRAWSRWLAEMGLDAPADSQGLSGALAVHSIDRRHASSPIHCGFSVVDRAVWDRAEEIDGASAFVLDEEGDRQLEPPWSKAANALLEAAMAFGAPQLSDEQDRRVMSAAWTAVIGAPPPGSRSA